MTLDQILEQALKGKERRLWITNIELNRFAVGVASAVSASRPFPNTTLTWRLNATNRRRVVAPGA